MTEDEVIALLKEEMRRQANERIDHFAEEVTIWSDDGEQQTLPNVVAYDGRLDLGVIARLIVERMKG